MTHAIPCKRPKVTAEPDPATGLFKHVCHVPRCGWTFVSVKSAQEPGWHRRDHRVAVPSTELTRGERGFVAKCPCGWVSYDGAETSRESVEQTLTYHLSKSHGLVSCS